MSLDYRKIISLLICITALIVFLYWLNSINLDTGLILKSLKSISIPFLLLAISFAWLEVFLRIFRLQRIIRFYGHNLSMRKIVPVFFVGMFAGNLTPMKIGEPIKAIILKRNNGVPLTIGVISTLVERLLDMIFLIFFLLFSIIIVGYNMQVDIIILLLLLFLGGYILLMSGFLNKKLQSITDKIFKKIKKGFITKIQGMITQFITSTESKSLSERIQTSARWFIVSLLIFFVDIVVSLLLFKAFGVDIAFIKIIFVVIFSTLIGLISQTPGGLVTTEGASTYLFTQFGILPEVSLSVTIIGRLFSYYLFMTIGWVYMLKEGWKFT